MPELVSADHIAAGGSAGGFEPQRTNNFTIRIFGDRFSDRMLEMTLHSFQLPQRTTEILEVPFGNEVRKVPGRTTFPDRNLVVKDYVDQSILAELEAWESAVFNPVSGATGYANVIKTHAHVFMFGPDGERRRWWKLVGVWLSDLDPGEMSMERPANHLVTARLTYDKAIPIVMQQGSVSAA